MTDEKAVETIELKFTWAGMLQPLLALYTEADTHDARQTAWKELRKMAIAADRWSAVVDKIHKLDPEGESIATAMLREASEEHPL